jgi:hypothetical protein
LQKKNTGKPVKSKSFILPYVIYPFDIMFSFGEPDDVLFRRLKSMGITEPELCNISGITQARTVVFNEGASIIRMKHIPKTSEDFGHLQHEIFHAVYFLFTRIGIKLCDKSDEAFAYTIQYLTEQVYKRI